MQRRVTRPPHGRIWRAHKRGYIEGIFLVDGRRRFLNLGRLEDVLHNGSGRRRTAKRVNGGAEIAEKEADSKKIASRYRGCAT